MSLRSLDTRTWFRAPLRQVAKQIDRWESPSPGVEYRLIGVKWWGGGVHIHDTVGGSETRATQLRRVCADDLVINKIWARHGSVAVVPEAFDGCYGSGEFPTFQLDLSQVSPRWLHWLAQSKSFWAECEELSRGTSGKNRIKPERFLGIQIPLPPLPEQQRIVVWLDSLAARVSAAKALWSERTEDYRQLTRGLLFTSDAQPEPTPFSSLLTRRPLDVEVEPDGEYTFGGVYCFGRGMFRREPKRGSEFAYKQLTRIHAGEFCYPKLMAWEGAFAVVPPECDGCVVSPEFPVFTINSELVLPEVLDAYFRLPETWETLAGSSTGTNLRRRRLNPTTLLAADMPLPPMALQEKFRAVTNHLKAAEAELGAIETNLAALMPSALAQVFGG